MNHFDDGRLLRQIVIEWSCLLSRGVKTGKIESVYSIRVIRP